MLLFQTNRPGPGPGPGASEETVTENHVTFFICVGAKRLRNAGRPQSETKEEEFKNYLSPRSPEQYAFLRHHPNASLLSHRGEGSVWSTGECGGPEGAQRANIIYHVMILKHGEASERHSYPVRFMLPLCHLARHLTWPCVSEWHTATLGIVTSSFWNNI